MLLTPPPENTDTAFSTAPRADLPVGGRLAAFSQAWKEIGAPRRIVRWLSHGYPLPFRKNSRGLEVTPPLHTDPLPHLVTRYSDPVKQAALESMLDELITKRALRVVDHNVPVHFSSCLLVPKKNGKQRLVINLRPLNQFLDCPTFTMDHAATIREVLAPQMWAASLDLADAYLHIPIAERYWKFLAIQVGTRRMLFTVLPFGLNAAPRVFSDVMKVLKKWCRLHGMILFQYLDDWLQVHLFEAELRSQVATLLQQCRRLGLLVNLEKSELVPSQKIVFLGDELDFIEGFCRPSQDRLSAIRLQIKAVTRRAAVKFHVIHSLFGLLTATEKIVPYGRIHLRCLQIFLNWHMKRGVKRFQKVTVPSSVLLDLLWWVTESNVAPGISMVPSPPSLQIQTDASTTGWGVMFQGSVLSGQWSAAQRQMHINYLEMLTVLIACQKLLFHLRGRSVLFLVDNQTVVSYIEKQGGTHSIQLMSLTERLWLLAEENLIWLQARHIKGSHNVVADLASRKGCVVNTEWSLVPSVFQRAVASSPFPPPQIDLFANRLNHQLPLFFSPCPDQQAMAVDALLTQWPRDIPIYAFPPTTIMDRVLSKITLERPRALMLVAPYLLEAVWFPRLQLLPSVRSAPLNLQVGDLRQPHWNHVHPDPGLFKLHLWFISFPD